MTRNDPYPVLPNAHTQNISTNNSYTGLHVESYLRPSIWAKGVQPTIARAVQVVQRLHYGLYNSGTVIQFPAR